MIYKAGDLFAHVPPTHVVSKIYILSQVHEGKWCLVGMDGNRWSDPVRLITLPDSEVDILDDSALWGQPDSKNSWELLKNKKLKVVDKRMRTKTIRGKPVKKYRRIVL